MLFYLKAINETEVSKDTNQHSDIRYLVIPSQQSNDQFTQFTPKRRSSAVWSTAHHGKALKIFNSGTFLVCE